jgi:hypothetical protein
MLVRFMVVMLRLLRAPTLRRSNGQSPWAS